MKLLEGKTALVFGVANDHSIGWGIAKTMHEHGAKLAFSYAVDALERRVRPLAESVGSDFVEKCDLSSDDEIEHLFKKVDSDLGPYDILVHAVAFADRDELMGDFHMTSREGFRVAMDISVYSFIAIARASIPFMPNGGSMLTLSYHASVKVFPNYNVMAIAKAALENTTRYLAVDLGPRGIRVNAISPGPIRTLSAAGVSGFKKLHREFANVNPLRSNVTSEDVGGAALWLSSDYAKNVTGEVLYVDSGYNILGVTVPTDDI